MSPKPLPPAVSSEPVFAKSPFSFRAMAVMSEPFDWESLQFLDHHHDHAALPHTSGLHTATPQPPSDNSNSYDCSFSASFLSAAASASVPETSVPSSLPDIVHSSSNSPSSVRAASHTALGLLANDNYLPTRGTPGHNRTFSDISVSSSVSEGCRSTFSPAVQLPRRGRPPNSGTARRGTSIGASRRKPSPSTTTEAPPGTILLYNNAKSVQSDRPLPVGSLDRAKMTAYAASNTAKATHLRIAATIKKEFAAEDCFRRMLQDRRGRARGIKSNDAEYLEAARIGKRRRLQGTGCEWRPESVYKTYVDCKPRFFDQSDYQDTVPEDSCFGKINMRIPKAWTRGPNRKRARFNHQRSRSGPAAIPERNPPIKLQSSPLVPALEPHVQPQPMVHMSQAQFEAHQASIQAQLQVQQMAYAVPDENEDYLLEQYLYQQYRG